MTAPGVGEPTARVRGASGCGRRRRTCLSVAAMTGRRVPGPPPSTVQGLLHARVVAPVLYPLAMATIQSSTVPNGLPIHRIHVQGTRAVTVLVAFDAGARTEREEENGMAHFLEHLVFKGGEKYASYRDVNETAERLGAQLNAYTSHDVVAFHITARAESLMPAVDLLTDFVARARI